MFASSVHHLLHDAAREHELLDAAEPFDGHWTQAPEREQLREAVLAGDDARLDESIERMVSRVAPELAIHRRIAATRRRSRRQLLERELHAWVEARTAPPTEESRRETRALNGELREWFAVVHVRNTATDTVIAGRRPPTPQEGMYSPPVEVRLSRAAWARASRSAGRRPRRPAAWSDEEIIAALQDWAARHGRAPNSCEWLPGSPDRPGSLCVRRRFGTWERALKRAGLKVNARRQGRYWTNAEIINSLRAWAKRHGRAPTAADWTRAQRAHPCSRSVAQHFGAFKAAVLTAGLAST
jgi:hypothetical protein